MTTLLPTSVNNTDPTIPITPCCFILQTIFSPPKRLSVFLGADMVKDLIRLLAPFSSVLGTEVKGPILSLLPLYCPATLLLHA
jgi:hypothetical protein